MLVAQKQHFMYEGMGIPINQETLQKMTQMNPSMQITYPFLFEGTSATDFNEAEFVMEHGAVWFEDLKAWWDDGGLPDTSWNCNIGNDEFMDGESHLGDEVSTVQAPIAAGMALLHNNHEAHVTPQTRCLHQQICDSNADDKDAITEEERVDARKDIMEAIDYMLYDKACRKVDRRNIVADVLAIRQNYVKERQDRTMKKNNAGRSVYIWNSPTKGKAPMNKRFKGVAG